MKYLLVVAVLFSNLYFSQSTGAQAFADAFDEPLHPSALYKIDQRHKDEYCSKACKAGKESLKYHIGEDRNKKHNGNCDIDFGDNVYSIANGYVSYAEHAGPTWGNVVIILHVLPDLTVVNSMYAHLSSIDTAVTRHVSIRHPIGKVGKVGTDCAHLHFEIRTSGHLGRVPGRGYASSRNDPIYNHHAVPSDFIRDH